MEPLFIELEVVRPDMGKCLVNLAAIDLVRPVHKDQDSRSGQEIPKSARSALVPRDMSSRALLVTQEYEAIRAAIVAYGANPVAKIETPAASKVAGK